jgi:hypothetical protein
LFKKAPKKKDNRLLIALGFLAVIGLITAAGLYWWLGGGPDEKTRARARMQSIGRAFITLNQAKKKPPTKPELIKEITRGARQANNQVAIDELTNLIEQEEVVINWKADIAKPLQVIAFEKSVLESEGWVMYIDSDMGNACELMSSVTFDINFQKTYVK